jgi:hypothetical protein
VAGAEEAVRADDREAHRVLVAAADPLRFPLVRLDPVEARVSGDEESIVGRIDAQAMDVDRARVGGGDARERLLALVG